MTMRASKRTATSDLNHENWNQEEESEEAGTYEQAPADVIGRRKIRVARRRGVTSEESAGTGGLFKSFTGFGSGGLGGAAVPNFNFGATANDSSKTSSEPSAKRAMPSFGGFDKPSTATLATKVPAFQFGAASSGAPPSTFSFGTRSEASSKSSSLKTTTTITTTKEDVPTRDRHLHMLRSLNLSVNKWISSHVEKDPYCDLTPVFADYEKHLREIERQYPYEGGDASSAASTKNNKDSPASPTASEPPPSNGKGASPPKPTFSFLTGTSNAASALNAAKRPTVAANFGLTSSQLTAVSEDKEDSAEEDEEEEKPAKKNKNAEKPSGSSVSFAPGKPFSFGFDAGQPAKQKEDQDVEEPEKEKPAPTLFSGMSFNFGGAAKASTSSIGTSLTSTPFSFGFGGAGSSAASTFASTATKEEEEPYVPPKAEVKEIKEEGAVLTKRCKLFYKSEDAWQDKGVGNLHLKPIEAGKVQAIIRADTNLGTILLNVMLTKIIPITRQKNNLTLLCVPSPPMKPVKKDEEAPNVPMPLLVRFKTEPDCEEVLKEIERLREEKQ